MEGLFHISSYRF